MHREKCIAQRARKCFFLFTLMFYSWCRALCPWFFHARKSRPRASLGSRGRLPYEILQCCSPTSELFISSFLYSWLPHTKSPISLSFSPNSELFASSFLSFLYSWIPHTKSPISLSFSPNSELFASSFLYSWLPHSKSPILICTHPSTKWTCRWHKPHNHFRRSSYRSHKPENNRAGRRVV